MPKRWPTRLSSAGLALALFLVACSSDADRELEAEPRSNSGSEPPVRESTTSATVAVAGDIACVPGMAVTPDQCQMEATAQLVESLSPAAVLVPGDLQYEYGEAANFAASYEPTWGRFKSITYPAVGNHDWGRSDEAAGYFAYWGGRAGPTGKGWYAFDLPNGWRGLALNSVCSAVGCGEGSEQLAWLRTEVGKAKCTLAFWHHPYKTSGLHGPDKSVEPMWLALRDAGAELVLSGHDHHYERFAPDGSLRQFVAGIGGRNLYPVLFRSEGSEAVHTTGFGVLALTLRADGYDWRFRGIPGNDFTDSGSAACTP